MAPRGGWVHASSAADRAPDARTPARFRTGVRIATDHPPGRSRRTASAEVVQRLQLSITAHHLLSFVIDPTRCRAIRASAIRNTSRDRPQPRQRLPVAWTPAPRAPRRAPGRRRSCGRRVTTTSGRDARCRGSSVLSGVSHFAIVSRKPPWSSSSCVHCWTVPLPNVFSPTSVARPRSWSAPATISDADARAPVDEHDEPDRRVGRRAARQRGGLGQVAVGVLLPEDRARRRGTGSRCRARP